jgi:putative ABC transport system permease protein
MVAGRDFTPRDVRESPAVIVVNETMARRFGGNQEAIGKLLSLGPGNALTIVGVVRDSKYWSLGESDESFAYFPWMQAPTHELTFCMRTSGDATAMLESLANEIRAIDRDLALSGLQSMGQLAQRTLWPARIAAILFAALGCLALVLAVCGVYGVVSYSMTRRRLEIGVRTALGGDPRQIVWYLVRRGLRVVIAGALVGVGMALWLTRYLSGYLSGASPTDLTVYLVVPVALVAVAGAAIYVPARKAAGVDPMVVLRYE